MNGVRYSNFFYNDNLKAKDGRLFLGEMGGYYSFYPDQLKDTSIAPQLAFSIFKLGDKEIKAQPDGVLTAPLWKTEEIELTHDQNVFSFDFFAIDFISPGDEKYLFMLENYDDEWHDIGSDHRASFFNIPPGIYNFRVKAVSGDGSAVEKSIRIIISPPWWKTWWAYLIYAVLAIVTGYLIYKYQKTYIVKRERQRTQEKELAQAKEIEKAYNELKTTQQQLIQSEKMASLGELTAGIAHEIQNPLNFVNNFSDVNTELVDELKNELATGNMQSAIEIADNIKENEQKINHHGKRADAIVKGMLQHSRSNSGQKELTDINALADEYLRLAYHGLRAKDKSFNANFKTDFDDTIGKVNIIPQEMGRVVLNLINNAFYAVDEKKKNTGNGYEPTVSVTTKRSNGKVEIKVSDNGNGIPQKVLDKIFQPFFTTKPTGQGTGLGLSLSYDIVKAHGGELRVETREREGSIFIIELPI
jgi:signal transduction histidine kinase